MDGSITSNAGALLWRKIESEGGIIIFPSSEELFQK